MKKKVLITQPWSPSLVTNFDTYVGWLEKRGFEVIIDPKQDNLNEQDVIERLPGVYAYICGPDDVTEKALEYADQLKIISRIGVGYDSINIPVATQKGIAVLTTPGAGAETVAEFAFALMISLSRRVLNCDKSARDGSWLRISGPSLYRKTLGIMGLGAIGKQLAKIVSGFDMKVIAYDTFIDDVYADNHNITYVTMEELFRNSDYISLHLPLNKDTRNLINEETLKIMKPTVHIINCSRGGVIDERALYNSIKNHEIAGAALDVVEQEPINLDNPLLTLDNVILTTHNAGTSVEGKNKVVEAAINNVLDIIDGKVPNGLKNPDVLKKATYF